MRIMMAYFICLIIVLNIEITANTHKAINTSSTIPQPIAIFLGSA